MWHQSVRNQTEEKSRYSLSRMRRSRRLFPVGPVSRVSPSAVNSGQASKAASAACGSKPRACARATVAGSARAPAAGLLPSAPSLPAERQTTGCTGSRWSKSRAQARANCWLRPPVPGCAIDADGDFAAGEQAEFAARMLAAQLDQAIDQVGGGLVVRPIVAAVVHDDLVAERGGFLLRGAHRSRLESSVASQLVRPAARSWSSRSLARRLAPGQPSGLFGVPLHRDLVAWGLGQIGRLKKRRTEGGNFSSRCISLEQFAAVVDGGGVGEGWAGGDGVRLMPWDIDDLQGEFDGAAARRSPGGRL